MAISWTDLTPSRAAAAKRCRVADRTGSRPDGWRRRGPRCSQVPGRRPRQCVTVKVWLPVLLAGAVSVIQSASVNDAVLVIAVAVVWADTVQSIA